MKVVFCWHMHQPDYRDSRSGEYQLPWVYLHAIKDYVDMVAHLEVNSKARVVVNFSPILLLQIENYSEQIQLYFDSSKTIKDPLLNALVDPTLPSSTEHRHGLIKACTKANEKHLINRFEPFKRLVLLANWLDKHPDQIRYFNGQFFSDLFVWYHLAWLGETVRRNNQMVKALIAKETSYTVHDRRELLAVIGELIRSVIPRYRRLMEIGQIELSLTPYGHPIVPLLIDIHTAKESMPEVALPIMAAYPSGEARAKWHVQTGIDVFKQFFGVTPAGCWLSEGGISDAAVQLLDASEFLWTASGENVLRNSLRYENTSTSDKSTFLYRPYQLNENRVQCFFRDDDLSDLIGFTYSDWHADDAVGNLIARLKGIAKKSTNPDETVVSIILDGENAWEYYPQNGYYFLNSVYTAIVDHPDFELATYADCLAQRSMQTSNNTELSNPVGHLGHIVAGSWVYGTFSTWVGDEQKNRAWDMLADAKRSYDTVMAAGTLTTAQRQQAITQLATCESSDWFWWFGDVNPTVTVSDFDRLFRMHLSNLYLFLGVEPPNYLVDYFTHSSGNPVHGGVMKSGSQ